MLKPIEVGCMAIIVRSDFPENVGVQVTVVTHDPSDKDGYIWEFEASTDIICTFRNFPERRNKIKRAWCLGTGLLRIDGFDEPQQDDAEIVDRLAWQSF